MDLSGYRTANKYIQKLPISSRMKGNFQVLLQYNEKKLAGSM
jgi:hypothetical protein